MIWYTIVVVLAYLRTTNDSKFLVIISPDIGIKKKFHDFLYHYYSYKNYNDREKHEMMSNQLLFSHKKLGVFCNFYFFGQSFLTFVPLILVCKIIFHWSQFWEIFWSHRSAKVSANVPLTDSRNSRSLKSKSKKTSSLICWSDWSLGLL